MDTEMRRRNDDTTPEIHDKQCELYRNMSEAEKLKLVFQTYRAGRRLAMTGLRIRHPEADEREIHRLWARRHLGADLFDEVFGAIRCE